MPGFDLITQRLTVAKFLDDIQGPTYPGLDSFIRTELQDVDDLESIPFFRKGIELSAADLEIIPGERAEISKISTMALDRDKEVLLPEGADLRFFRNNPVVPYAHDYYGLPIGQSEWVKIDNKATPTTLIAKTKYASKEANPLAEQVYLLIIEGILRAKSVGFIPLKWRRPGDDDWVEAVTSWRSRREVMLGKKTQEADPERIYTKWVLLEYSPVPIPSNPEALQLAIKKNILTLDQARSGGFVQEDDIGIESISLELAMKPYANEHACRLKDPDKYDEWARENCKFKHDGKCIDAIYGIKAGTSELQAYRYPKDIWTATSAKTHCQAHDGTFEAAKEVDTPTITPDLQGLIREEVGTLVAEYLKAANPLPGDEISDEQVQEILSMVSDQLAQKTEDEDEPTVEELIQFASGKVL